MYQKWFELIRKFIAYNNSVSFSGDVFKIFDDEPFYTLKTALNKIFSPTELNYQQCLLTH